MKKLIMSAALIVAMFGFSGCDSKKMTPEEKTTLEKILSSKNSSKIEEEFLIAVANDDAERLLYFTSEIISKEKQTLLAATWKQRKAEMDKVLLDITTGALKPSQFEIKALISQINNKQSLRIDYVRETLLPAFKDMVVEEKK